MKRKFVSFLTGALLLATVPMQTLAADASVTTVDVTQAGDSNRNLYSGQCIHSYDSKINYTV